MRLDMDTTIISDAELLARIEAFCKRHKVKPTSFGRMSLGDGMLIPNLKKGRSLTLKNAAKVGDFMATYAEQAAA